VETGGRRFHQPPYRIEQCLTCHLYYKSTTVPLDELAEYYASLDFSPFDVDASFPTDEYLIQWLDKLEPGSRVLDYGCSTGRILKNVTARLQCFGVEPNAQAAAVASSRGIGIVELGDLIRGEYGQFDAILLMDVYEHLPSPLDLLRDLSTLLAPAGRLVIVTGTADRMNDHGSIGEHWYFRIVGHLHALTEEHVHWLADELHLTVQTIHRCSHYTLRAADRLKQLAQSVLYNQFHQGASWKVKMLEKIPGINRAASWTSAPAVTYKSDHIVAVLTARS
jgi:SAM-dependent methyltransferase